MAYIIKSRTTFPEEVGEKSAEAVTLLEKEGFFSSQFENHEDAKRLFFDRFSNSLLSKFISGDDIEWEGEEYDRVLTLASVEHAVDELESEGKVHRFDDVVVLARKTF
jgi:hypothetical protein